MNNCNHIEDWTRISKLGFVNTDDEELIKRYQVQIWATLLLSSIILPYFTTGTTYFTGWLSWNRTTSWTLSLWRTGCSKMNATICCGSTCRTASRSVLTWRSPQRLMSKFIHRAICNKFNRHSCAGWNCYRPRFAHRYTGILTDPNKSLADIHRDTLLDILSDARVAAPMLQTGLYLAKVNPKCYMYVFGHNSEAGEYGRVSADCICSMAGISCRFLATFIMI